jgi:hypothetical protein
MIVGFLLAQHLQLRLLQTCQFSIGSSKPSNIPAQDGSTAGTLGRRTGQKRADYPAVLASLTLKGLPRLAASFDTFIFWSPPTPKFHFRGRNHRPGGTRTRLFALASCRDPARSEVAGGGGDL